MTELRRLAMGVVILGSTLTGSLGAMAAGPDASAPDRELVLGLRVAPPFALKTPDGIWTEISVELWRHLAEQLRLRFRFEETTQEGLLKGLADGTLDASGGALTVTAERLREMDFSLPYAVTGLGVAVPLRASLDWIGVAASFLSIRFLSTLLVIVGLVLLVSVIVWLLERRLNSAARRLMAWSAPSAGRRRRWPRPRRRYRRRRGPDACLAGRGRRPQWC